MVDVTIKIKYDRNKTLRNFEERIGTRVEIDDRKKIWNYRCMFFLFIFIFLGRSLVSLDMVD